MKRFLSIFLCFAICLTLLPGVSVSADPGTMEGDGSSENPYQIATAEHLLQFRDLVNGGKTDAWAILVKDIVFNEGVTFAYRSGEQDEEIWINDAPLTQENAPKDRWVPISVPSIPFMELLENPDMELKDGWYTGTFDGKGHTISGLYCDYPTEMMLAGMSAAALFTSLGPGGVVRNVGIENSLFRGDAAASIVVGSQGTVQGCYSNAIVYGYPQKQPAENAKSVNSFAGGIVCFTIREHAAIERCYYGGTVRGVTISEEGKEDRHQFGGILGSIGVLNEFDGAKDFTDNYYKEGLSVTIPGCEPKSAAEFSEGVVAHLLNNSATVNDESVLFRQNLDKQPKEDYPSFRESSGEVYKVNGCKENVVFYSNFNERRDTHEFNSEGICVNGCNGSAAATYTVGENTVFAAEVAEAFNVQDTKEVAIQLLSDCTAGVVELKENCTYTLDLNGKTLDVSAIYITGSNSILVIRDQVGGGVLQSSFDLTPITVSGGELYVESGKIAYSGNKTGTPAVTLISGYAEISGGEFVGNGTISTVLAETAQITGGKFAGMRCDVNISDILGAGDQKYVAVGTDGKILDVKNTVLEQEFEVMLEKDAASNEETTEPTDEATEPTDEATEPTDPATEPTDGTEPNESVTEPTVDEENLVKPDLPELGEDKTPVVGIPTVSGMPSVCKDELYLILDADPLLGVSRQELLANLSVPDYEGYETVFEISEYDEKLDMVRTSDRLTISYQEKDKVIQSRTFVIVILGDTNCDGMAMANDAALMAKLIQGSDIPELLLAADVNNDGAVKANDAQRLIYRYFNYSIGYASSIATESGG